MEKVALVSAAVALVKVTVPGPEVRDQVLVSVPEAGRPSSVMVPSRDAVAGRVIAWSAPALTTGGWLVGPPEPVVYSTWRSGAKLAPPSNASAVLRPVPRNCTASALPWAQPARLTTACTSDARFGVRWAVPASPTTVQSGGVHAMLAAVVARFAMLLAAVV